MALDLSVAGHKAAHDICAVLWRLFDLEDELAHPFKFGSVLRRVSPTHLFIGDDLRAAIDSVDRLPNKVLLIDTPVSLHDHGVSHRGLFPILARRRGATHRRDGFRRHRLDL